jgi:predicted membrane channel-forming protein YqfA (hemolysin III family)
MLSSFISAIGESDCERIGTGVLAQPVNAISSLAFALFGLIVLFSIRAQDETERINRLIFGVLMISTGIGSVLFHGPQGPSSHFLHDATILLTMTAIVTMNLAGLLEWTERRVMAILATVGVGVSVVLVIWPTSTNVIAGLALVALVIQDVALHRSGSVNTRWWITAVVAMAVALLFFVAGRTGGPLCDSASLFQGHALWHTLAATALWAYFMATTPTRLGIGS